MRHSSSQLTSPSNDSNHKLRIGIIIKMGIDIDVAQIWWDCHTVQPGHSRYMGVYHGYCFSRKFLAYRVILQIAGKLCGVPGRKVSHLSSSEKCCLHGGCPANSSVPVFPCFEWILWAYVPVHVLMEG